MLTFREELRVAALMFKLTYGYDESHGPKHCIDVKNKAVLISKDYHFTLSDMVIIMVASYCHELFDHKYVEEELRVVKRKEVDEFLEEMFPAQKRAILLIIDNMSFSTERKHGYPHFLDSPEYKSLTDCGSLTLLRNDVSDADKIDGLKMGRCKIYTWTRMDLGEFPILEKQTYPQWIAHYEHLSDTREYQELKTVLADEMKLHYDEKLSKLTDEYIHTPKGIELGRKSEKHMLEYIDDFRRNPKFT